MEGEQAGRARLSRAATRGRHPRKTRDKAPLHSASVPGWGCGGAVLALPAGQLGALGKLLCQSELQFSYLFKKKKAKTILFIPGECCISRGHVCKLSEEKHDLNVS